MLDGEIWRIYDLLVKIVWDERKRLANLDKHGMDFADLTFAFFASATIYPGKTSRFIAVGDLEGRSVTAVVFRPLGKEALSVISMRVASIKERSRR